MHIRDITYHKKIKPINFLKVIFPNGDNFVAERAIIHTNVVNFLLINAGRVQRRITLGASPDTTFSNLKKQLIDILGTDALVLCFDGKILEEE